MYSLIFSDDILICYRNIYKGLEYICVVLQHAFRGTFYKSTMNRNRVMENSNLFCFVLTFHRQYLKNGLDEAMYHQIYTVNNPSCYKDIYQSQNEFDFSCL